MPVYIRVGIDSSMYVYYLHSIHDSFQKKFGVIHIQIASRYRKRKAGYVYHCINVPYGEWEKIPRL